MSPFLQIIQMGFEAIVAIFFNLFFWLVIFLIYMQYKKTSEIEIQILGKEKRSLKDKTIHAAALGLLGGIVGTVVMMGFGVTVDAKDFLWLLPLALLLMTIHVRYLCFSYAGGLLSFSSLVFGFPKINVPSIMAIVAILHLIESILIRIDGCRDAIPVFQQDARYGIIGGFTLQRFWPIPFAVLLLSVVPIEGAQEIHFPDWWPLFRSGTDILEPNNIALQITAVIAALGYGDLAFTQTPKEKSKRASRRLFFYSIGLFGLALLAEKIKLFQYIAAIFAPLAHEMLIFYGQKEEKKGLPIFRQHTNGITVLDVEEGSAAMKMGLEQGDIILSINNRPVKSKEEIQEILRYYPSYIWLDVMNLKGKMKMLHHQNYRDGIHNLGILVVSEDVQGIIEPEASASLLGYLFKKWRRFRR